MCVRVNSQETLKRYVIKLPHKTHKIEGTGSDLRQLKRKCKNLVLTNLLSTLTVDVVLFFATIEFLLFPFH